MRSSFLRRGLALALGAAMTLGGCAGFEEQAAVQLAASPGARILTLGDSVMW